MMRSCARRRRPFNPSISCHCRLTMSLSSLSACSCSMNLSSSSVSRLSSMSALLKLPDRAPRQAAANPNLRRNISVRDFPFRIAPPYCSRRVSSIMQQIGKVMKFLALSTALVLSGLALSAPAFADRAPNADELATLTERLNELGYQSRKEIELDEDGDDGPHWEVDDARKEDGTVWDLKLSVDKMEVIELDRED